MFEYKTDHTTGQQLCIIIIIIIIIITDIDITSESAQARI